MLNWVLLALRCSGWGGLTDGQRQLNNNKCYGSLVQISGNTPKIWERLDDRFWWRKFLSIFVRLCLKFDWLLSRNIKILLTARYAKRFTLDDLGFFYKVSKCIKRDTVTLPTKATPHQSQLLQELREELLKAGAHVNRRQFLSRFWHHCCFIYLGMLFINNLLNPFCKNRSPCFLQQKSRRKRQGVNPRAIRTMMSLASTCKGTSETFEKWKTPWLFRVERGWYPTQLCGDYSKPLWLNYRDPY